MRRVLADLEAICALYPPVSQSLEYIYTRLLVLFFKLLCTVGFSQIKRAQNPKQHLSYMLKYEKFVTFFVAIMHSHSYKLNYSNLITYLPTYLVLGICSVHSPQARTTCRHLVTGLSYNFCLQLNEMNK